MNAYYTRMLILNHSLFLKQLHFTFNQLGVLVNNNSSQLSKPSTWLLKLFLEILNSYVRVIFLRDEITAFEIQVVQPRFKKTLYRILWAANYGFFMDVE